MIETINNFWTFFRQKLNSINMRISISKRELILIFLGTFFICLGLIAIFGVPLLVMNVIHKELQLEPNTEASKVWKDIPVPIYQRIYFFNVTNPTDIERHGAKPVLVEMGPYTYRSKWTKSLDYNQNGTVSYREKKTYYFVRELSSGNESDLITSLNGPLAITLSLLQKAPSAVRVIVTLALDAVTEGFFIKRTVNQLLFDGYPDLLTTFGPLLNPKIPSSNNGRFGWLYGKNGSNDGLFTVFTGKDDMSKLNIIDKFNGRGRLDYWREKSFCNSIRDSTDAQIFPPITNSNKSLYIFHPEFCRRWKLNFAGQIEKRGVNIYRYKPDQNNFKNADDYPPNACYLSRLPTAPNPSLFSMPSSRSSSVRMKRIRFASGVFDMSSCKYGAPIVMSYPHFLGADPIYAESLEGVEADPSKHEFYLDIEPNTGTSMGSAARLQINVFINKPPGMFRYRNVPEIVFPVFWQELGANVSSDMTERIKWVLEQPSLISSIASTSMLFIGVLFVLTSILFPFYDNYIKGDKIKESGSVVYTDKPTANSQIDIRRIITNDNKPEDKGIDNKALDPNL